MSTVREFFEALNEDVLEGFTSESSHRFQSVLQTEFGQDLESEIEEKLSGLSQAIAAVA